MEILKDVALVFDTIVAVGAVVALWRREQTTEILADSLEDFDLYLEALKGDKRVKSQKATPKQKLAEQKRAGGQTKTKKSTKKA